MGHGAKLGSGSATSEEGFSSVVFGKNHAVSKVQILRTNLCVALFLQGFRSITEVSQIFGSFTYDATDRVGVQYINPGDSVSEWSEALRKKQLKARRSVLS